LHSSLSSRRQWRKLQQQIQPHYRVMGLDLLGYGETPMPANAEGFSFAQEVDLVERLLERARSPVHLVGHSYGGAIALKTALRHPGRVHSVYAHEPVVFALLKSEGCLDEWNEIANISLGAAHQVEIRRPAQAAEGFVNYWSGAGAWQQLSEERKRAFEQTIPKIALDFAAISNDSDGLTEYQKLTMPVLLTAGDSGAQTGRRAAELLSGGLPRGSLRIVEGAGHLAPITDADRINAIITAHLEACSAGETE
jgi:pimeloyl-ACP methyl ester carboxylesterase